MIREGYESDPAYRELLGMATLEVLEIGFDHLHLFLCVAVGEDGAAALDAFLPEVESVEQDGDAGLLGDIVETHFPLGVEREIGRAHV